MYGAQMKLKNHLALREALKNAPASRQESNHSSKSNRIGHNGRKHIFRIGFELADKLNSDKTHFYPRCKKRLLHAQNLLSLR